MVSTFIWTKEDKYQWENTTLILINEKWFIYKCQFPFLEEQGSVKTAASIRCINDLACYILAPLNCLGRKLLTFMVICLLCIKFPFDRIVLLFMKDRNSCLWTKSCQAHDVMLAHRWLTTRLLTKYWPKSLEVSQFQNVYYKTR